VNQKKIRLFKNLSTGLVLVAVVLAFFIAGIRVFGVQVFGVLTGSMEPAFPTGSLIYVKDVDAADLRVNDVITFSISPNVIATHRIVEVVPDESNPSIVRYRTKGDANRDVDASLVSAGNIIGKAMFAIPGLGYLANYIQEPPGIYVAILVCGLMIAFVFYADSLENKQKKAPGPGTRGALPNRLLKRKKPMNGSKNAPPAHTAYRQGYVPPQPAQPPYPYPPQQPYYGMPNQYPQQNYGQPGAYSQQPPYYPQQTPYPAQPPYPYPQQNAQQPYAAPDPTGGYPQPGSAFQPFQQPRNSRADQR